MRLEEQRLGSAVAPFASVYRYGRGGRQGRKVRPEAVVMLESGITRVGNDGL